MDWNDWMQQLPPQWRRQAQRSTGGGDDNSNRNDPIKFARRTLGSFGRGSAWLPTAVRERTFSRALTDFQDWWLMYLEQHPYRLLTGFLAVGLAVGYLAGRSTRTETSEEEAESRWRS